MADVDSSDVQATLRGSSEAFGRIVARHEKSVANLMWKFTRNQSELEELVQTVFVKVYFSLGGYKRLGSFPAWIHRIAIRVGYQFWNERDRSRGREITGIEGIDVAAKVDGTLDSAEAGRLVHQMLQLMSPRDRLVLTLTILEERSILEVAELTGWSQNSVKVQCFRARQRLRELLQENGYDRAE